jgi:KDO2-lipid IV(A) lauroyltransferase
VSGPITAAYNALARIWVMCILAMAGWSVAARARFAAPVGDALWWLAWPRRRVALANLRVCFPQLTERERRELGRRCFRNIARAALDHGPLWRGSRVRIRKFVRVDGAEHLRGAAQPLILIAPHFVGLSWRHPVCDRDEGSFDLRPPVERGLGPLAQARARALQRTGADRAAGSDLRAALRAMKGGMPFYYLPDMDHGAFNSIFVPFFGVPAATLPMVSRIARLIGARVAMAVTEMTADGYRLHIEPPWTGFPGASVEADTARMNLEIERWVTKFPDQYLWPHRRFKTRPPGAPPVY